MLELTPTQLKDAQEEALAKLISIAETPHYLSKMLGINVMVVKGWVSRGRVSKKGVKLIMRHPTFNKEFTAKELRPDL